MTNRFNAAFHCDLFASELEMLRRRREECLADLKRLGAFAIECQKSDDLLAKAAAGHALKRQTSGVERQFDRVQALIEKIDNDD